MRTLLFVALVLVVTACGSKETTDISLEAVAEPKPKPTANTQTPAPVTSEAVAPVATSDTKVADPKAATADADPKEANNKSTASEPKPKEPGSLWSDGSHWNAMFSLRTFRREGDSFLVLPTEAFRNKLSRLVADARKDERGTAQFEERTFILTLREAEEGGTFKVGGSYGFLFGGEPVAVEMKGRVREREIREDDSISSDGLIDAEFKVVGADPSKKDGKQAPAEQSANDKAASKEPEKKKIVETVKDENSSAAQKKRRAIARFEGQKSGSKTTAAEEKEDNSEEN